MQNQANEEPTNLETLHSSVELTRPDWINQTTWT